MDPDLIPELLDQTAIDTPTSFQIVYSIWSTKSSGNRKVQTILEAKQLLPKKSASYEENDVFWQLLIKLNIHLPYI